MIVNTIAVNLNKQKALLLKDREEGQEQGIEVFSLNGLKIKQLCHYAI